MATFDDPKIEACYLRELQYIEKIRAGNRWDENGILYVPFLCYGCNKMKVNFFMMTGDGVPMCLDCFNGLSDSLAQQPT